MCRGHGGVGKLPGEPYDEALLRDERDILQPGTHRIFVQLQKVGEEGISLKGKEISTLL